MRPRLLNGEQINDQRRRNRSVAGLADADDRVAEQELVVIPHQPGQERESAPDSNADQDNILTGLLWGNRTIFP
jgi:hypothetical protein